MANFSGLVLGIALDATRGGAELEGDGERFWYSMECDLWKAKGLFFADTLGDRCASEIVEAGIGGIAAGKFTLVVGLAVNIVVGGWFAALSTIDGGGC
jgi:hypothetical protein